MRTCRNIGMLLLALGVLCQCICSTDAHGEEWEKATSDLSFRRTTGWAFDIGWGMGSIEYNDSIATMSEMLQRAYTPQGLQLIAKQLVGPFALHQHFDFTWDTFGDKGVDSTGSLTRFSRSISFLAATAVRIRSRIQVEPVIGAGWTYTKTVAKRGSNPKLRDFKEIGDYSGVVAGAEILARASTNSAFRLLYTHGFFEKPVNRLTMLFGGFWTDDPDYEHLFAGVGIRTAWYAGDIRELIVMLSIGGAPSSASAIP